MPDACSSGSPGKCFLEHDPRVGDVVQALPGILLQAARHESADAARDGGGQRVVVGLELQHRGQRVRDRLARERRAAGQHLVAARRRRPRCRRAGRRPGRAPAPGSCRPRCRGSCRRPCRAEVIVGDSDGRTSPDRGVGLERLGQAEVEHLDRAVGGELDVGRLEVAVDHAAARARPRAPRRSARRSRSASSTGAARVPDAPARSSPATSSIARKRTPSGLVQAVDRGDVRVVQRGQQLGLALEAGQPLGVGGERRRAGP